MEQLISFEVPQPAAEELERRLDSTGLEIDARRVSGMGGILDYVVFVFPVIADTIEIVRAFLEAFPASKPTSIVIRSGDQRVIIETADMSPDEIVVQITQGSINLRIEK